METPTDVDKLWEQSFSVELATAQVGVAFENELLRRRMESR